jgi:hypothetical protein
MGRAVAPLLLVLLGGGCAQIFGIDPTSAAPPLSLSIDRRSIGATVVDVPQDLSTNTATYLLADADDPTGVVRVPTEQTDIGTWTANIRDTILPVEFDLPDVPTPILRQFDFPNKAVDVLFGVMEHPSPVAADPASTISVNVTLDVPFAGNEGFQLFTVGTWTVRGLEPPVVGAGALTPPTFMYSAMSPITGRPLEKITTDDAILVLRYVGNNLTGFLDATRFAQSTADTITGKLSPNPANDSVDIRIDQAGAAQRYTAVRPAVANPTFSWDVHAAPGYLVANNNGPLLQAAGVAITDPTTITVPFGNPFVPTYDWKSVITWSTQATRTFVPAGQTLTATLFAGMFQRAFPSAALEMKLPAGLPELVQIDGMSLSTDGQMLPHPTRAMTVTFVSNPPGATFYQLQLFELVPNAANTALEFKTAYAWSALDAKFLLPAEVLKPGKSYTLRAITVLGGYPAIADGDFRARELPIAISFLDSGVFQVMP